MTKKKKMRIFKNILNCSFQISFLDIFPNISEFPNIFPEFRNWGTWLFHTFSIEIKIEILKNILNWN